MSSLVTTDDAGDELMGELGLVLERLRHASAVKNYDGGGTDRLVGVRHARSVEIRLGERDGLPMFKRGAMVTWVRVEAPPFTFTGDDDGVVRAHGAQPAAAAAVFASLSPRPDTWSNIEGASGAEGIVVLRPITMPCNNQGWLYDLWLSERLARVTGASPLPDADTRRQRVPYRLG